MRNILFILLIICSFVSFAQQIVIEQYNLSINSNLDKVDLEYADSAFNQSAFHISLVKLTPDCREGGNCYNESIIREGYNWNTPASDSTFGTTYFKTVNDQYIDSSSLTEVDPVDFTFFLTRLLEGSKGRDKGEIVDLCYNPRHAVLFMNDRGKIIAIHEICFECGHTKVALVTSEIRHNRSSQFREIFKKYQLVK